MHAYTRFIAAILTAVLVLLHVPQPTQAAAFIDIQGHWARSAVEALAARDVVGGYPDRTFRPEQPITRAEFAKMAALAFTAADAGQTEAAFADTASHWAASIVNTLAAKGAVEGYPDGTFRPDQPITRTEGALIITRLLEVTDVEGFVTAKVPTFSDVGSEHWGHEAIAMAQHLGILPPFIHESFEPDTPLTRAEAAWLIHQSLRLSRESGRITFVDSEAQRLTIQTDNGRIRDYRMQPTALVLRKGKAGTAKDLAAGDSVVIVADRFGTPLLVTAEAPREETDWTKRIAELILDVYTQEELQQMIAGNWDVAAEGARRELIERLRTAGVSETEIEALLNQDWSNLAVSAQDRLEEAIAQQLNISPELAEALLKQDWTAAREKAQLEVAQHLLNRLLSTLDAA